MISQSTDATCFNINFGQPRALGQFCAHFTHRLPAACRDIMWKMFFHEVNKSHQMLKD